MRREINRYWFTLISVEEDMELTNYVQINVEEKVTCGLEDKFETL